MEWYYASEGAQHGPVSEVELQELVRSGKLTGENLVWRDGMPEWRRLGEVSELAGAMATPGAAASQVQPVASPYQTPASGARSPGYAGDIPNYLWQSIVVTILCCQPFGIVAIVFAARVDGLKRTGDLAGARDASDKAKMWCLWGVVTGLVVSVLYVLLMVSMQH